MTVLGWTPEDGPDDVPVNENVPETVELLRLADLHASPSTAANTNGGPPADPSSFTSRVTATRVDLAARIRDGIPPIDYLPASHGMLVRGKRHQIAAPKKEGKSITMLVHWATMVEAGARVVILDRENGANLYASRLEQITDALNLDPDELTERLAYYEFPRLRPTDGDELTGMCSQADIVVFDSQRMFLTDLDLDEDSSNDYAAFVGIAIDPLFRAGIATCILDNTGHVETKRTRGSSAKGDLNEIIFTLEATEPFNLTATGKVRLEITDSRFGNAGRWDMVIGGGTFQPWQSVDTEAAETPSGAWEPTALMERVSRHLELQGEPVSRHDITRDVIGKRAYLFTAISRLIADGYAVETPQNRIQLLQNYREPSPSSSPLVPAAFSSQVPAGSPLVPTVPGQFPLVPEPVEEDGSRSSSPLRVRNRGTTPMPLSPQTTVPAPNTDDDIPF